MKFTRELAIAFVSGEWTLDSLVERAKVFLGPARGQRWIKPLARRVLQEFGEHPPPPRLAPLTKFLDDDRGLRRAHCRFDDSVTPDLLSLARPSMTPAPGAPSSWALPELTTPGALADWLGVAPPVLDWLAGSLHRQSHRSPGPLCHYHYRWISKATGPSRLIEAPKPCLKTIQRQILEDILNKIPLHDAAHGFRRGRSVATYVAAHVAQERVLHIDLRDFFPSISAERVHALFRTVGYPEGVARLLTGLCTNRVSKEVLRQGSQHLTLGQRDRLMQIYRRPHLPQGAATSPALSNLACYRLDRRLTGLARRVSAKYNRYADDLVFSGGEELARCLPRFRVFVCAIALDEGFAIQNRKTRVMSPGTRQQIAGVVLNVRPNIPRQEYDRLRATLHNCVRFAPHSQNREGHANFRDHLQGRIAYAMTINPVRGRRLQALFERIDW